MSEVGTVIFSLLGLFCAKPFSFTPREHRDHFVSPTCDIWLCLL